MTIKPARNPYGYRELLVYQKPDELQSLCTHMSSHFPPLRTAAALADQMNRSARSTKQNITEGWKRNSTKEYYEFLGYAIASNAELEEDYTDIWKGHYPELVGIKEIMGQKGERGENGETRKGEGGEKGIRGEKGGSIPPIETIPFYPLNPLLPLVVQLKLRAKELNFLLEKLQKSLVEKMKLEHTLPASEKMRIQDQEDEAGELWLRRFRAGLEGGKREKGE